MKRKNFNELSPSRDSTSDFTPNSWSKTHKAESINTFSPKRMTQQFKPTDQFKPLNITPGGALRTYISKIKEQKAMMRTPIEKSDPVQLYAQKLPLKPLKKISGFHST